MSGKRFGRISRTHKENSKDAGRKTWPCSPSGSLNRRAYPRGCSVRGAGRRTFQGSQGQTRSRYFRFVDPIKHRGHRRVRAWFRRDVRLRRIIRVGRSRDSYGGDARWHRIGHIASSKPRPSGPPSRLGATPARYPTETTARSRRRAKGFLRRRLVVSIGTGSGAGAE